MTYKIKKMVNNGTEYKIGSIDSSNDTYADIVHLTQAQYDALENPDPDTLYSTPDNVTSGAFCPENEGTPGQYLKKTQTGYKWDEAVVYYTESEYECLPDTKLTDNITYGIYDGDGTDNTLLSLIKNGVSYCIPQGGTKYGYVDILLVGGGGGIRSDSYSIWGSGGGGGGGVLEAFCYPIDNTQQSYSVTVGGTSSYTGGASCFGIYYACGGEGNDNTFKYCGGRSGAIYGDSTTHSGGKGCYIGCVYCNTSGGGGGGAGGNGCNGTSYTCGGDGGMGKASSITGQEVIYGYGGGGAGGDYCGQSYATCGSGARGGSGGQQNNGRPGLVVIRYKTDGSCGIKDTSIGGCKYTCGDYTIHCFTCNDIFIPVFK